VQDIAQTEIQRRGRQFALLTGLLALVILGAFAISMGRAFSAPPADRPALPVLYAVYWFPSLFYVWALIAIGRTFRDIGRGALFGSTIARGLRHVGWALLIGGIVNSFIIRVVHNSYLPRGFSTGETHAFRGLSFDPAYIMLVLIGLALLLLARLIQAAADERARADRLEAELGEFL
jgi:hypothetical protein